MHFKSHLKNYVIIFTHIITFLYTSVTFAYEQTNATLKALDISGFFDVNAIANTDNMNWLFCLVIL